MDSGDEGIRLKRQATVERYDRDFVELFISILPEGGRVLDVAFGTGKYWSMLKAGGLDIVGTEQSQTVLKNTIAKYPGIGSYNIDLQEIMYNGEFDGIICVDVMENIFKEYWLRVLGNFYRALRDKGILYFALNLEANEVQQWIAQSGFCILKEEAGDGYIHFLCQKNMEVEQQWLE